MALGANDMKTCRASLLLLAVSIFCAATASAATLYWKGPGNANAVANWCADAELTVAAAAVPADGDDIVLGAGAGNMTWNLNDVTPGSWTQTADYAGTVTFNTGRKNGMTTTLYGVTDDNGETRVFRVTGNCSIQGGKWTHASQPTFKNLTGKVAYTGGYGVYHIIAEIGGNMSIGSAVVITADGKGFPTGYKGPAGSGGNCSASHAGYGGKKTDTVAAPYGFFRAPKTIGSSSGNSVGGGCIEISVTGSLAIESGASFTAIGAAADYYVGAGGSISIMAGSISGAASFSARGATPNKSYPGGGGGRISIILTGEGSDFSSFTGTYTTHHRTGTANGTEDGSGGTTYLETKAQGVGGGTLIVDGVTRGWKSRTFAKGTPVRSEEAAFPLSKIVLRDDALVIFNGNVTIPAEVQSLAEVYADSSANILRVNGVVATLPANAAISGYTLSATSGSTIKLGSEGTGTLTLSGTGKLSVEGATDFQGALVVASGGEVTHAAGGSYRIDLNVSRNVTVEAGGRITATGKGYATQSGIGGSGAGNIPGLHAGRLRNISGKVHCYGSVRKPITCGSGGYCAGAYGGGAVKLVAGGAFVNNGSVEANGFGPVDYYSGSGGSVWITASTISGAGSFSANGGRVISKGAQAGGGTGSGGRVSLWLTNPSADFSSVTGIISAYGGDNAAGTIDESYVGGAGTIYMKSGSQAENEGTLIIRSARNTTYPTEFVAGATDAMSVDVTDTDVGDVVIDGYGRLLLTNVTVTVAGSWTNGNVFTANGNSTVVFTNAARVAHITGNNAFRSIVCTTPGKVIRFPASGTSVGAAGYFTIAGAAGSPVVLREESNGPWTFSVDAAAMTDVEYVDVANCDASGGQTIVARSSAASAGQNNTNWSFPSIEPGQTITWTGDASTFWTDPGNWDLGRIPVETDRAVVPALGSGANMPSLSGAAVQLCDLTVASGATLSLAGLNLTVTNAMTVAGAIVYSGSETVRCLGNVNLAGAAIDPSHGDFRIEGDLAQSVNLGNLEFWNVSIAKSGGSLAFSGGFTVQNRLYVSSSAPCGISFSSGAVVGCQYTVISGPAGGGLVLSGSGWNLNAAAYASVENCSVGGCTAGGIKIYPASSCTDLGSNVYWVFGTGIVRWTGGAGTTSFADGENWSSGSVPSANDRVLIDSAVTVAISESVSVKSIDLGGGESAAGLRVRAPLEVAEYVNVLTNGTLTADAACDVGGCLAVMGGGVLTHSANTSAGLYKMDIACGQLYVEEGGAVSAKGCGYPTQTGPGTGPMNCSAAYGGIGNPGQDGAAHAYCYGSVFTPVDLGSGGYYSNGAGGGAIKIFATGEMRVDGAIDADGQRGPQYYSGSGGSVYLSCSALTGCGAIRANGGVTTTGYQTGGGGRIAIYETVARDFSLWEGAATAYGGRHNGVDSPGGSAGTVYYQTAADAIRGGVVVIANMGGTYTLGTEIPASIAAGADSPRDFKNTRFELRNSAKMVVTADMKVRDVSVESGGYLYCTEHTLRIISSVHKDGKGWARQATTSPNGAVIWAAGFTVSVR